MALTRQALDKFYEDRKPYLEEIIGQDFMEHPTLWSQFLNTKSATSGWVDTATVSGFGLFNSKAELEDAASDDLIQGPVARTTIVTYAKRHVISQETIEDDMGDGIIASRLPEMMKSGRATQEVLGHSVLNGGFASITTPDSAYLFSTSHVNLSGTTFSNKLAVDLSQSNLETAFSMLQTMTNDRNIPIYQTYSKLIVSPTDEWAAKVILGSAQVPGSAYNDINPVQNSVSLLVSPYIIDNDSWFVFGNDHMLNWRWRIQPENWSEVNYANSSVQIGMRFRAAVEALDPRGVIGSTGA